MQPSALRTLPAGVIPEKPGPGQESVWDYPRPPRMDPVTDHVVVILDGEVGFSLREPDRLHYPVASDRQPAMCSVYPFFSPVDKLG